MTREREREREREIVTSCVENSQSDCNGSWCTPSESLAVPVDVLWQHAACKWPGCDTGCDNYVTFIRSAHLHNSHTTVLSSLPNKTGCYIAY